MKKIKLQPDGALLEEDAVSVRDYFEQVIQLADACDENEFVVNLEEVWVLAYNRKDNCLRALKKDFIEGVDYIVETIPTGEAGREEERYMISLKCMEFLIARKVRSVFEVYRKVFHRAVNELKVPESAVPFSERTRKNGWFCMKDMDSAQLFHLFQLAAKQELSLSDKTDAEKERDWVLAHFPATLSLVTYLMDSWGSPCASSRELETINRILSGARTWYEHHRGFGSDLSAFCMDYSEFGCAKAMTFHSEVLPPHDKLLLS